jgi:hypothetical protein
MGMSCSGIRLTAVDHLASRFAVFLGYVSSRATLVFCFVGQASGYFSSVSGPADLMPASGAGIAIRSQRMPRQGTMEKGPQAKTT